MTEQQKQKLSDKAQEAEKIVKEVSDDVKIAAEAMKRTARYKRTRFVQQRQYTYEQII
jgi:hypothetical protein